MPLALPEEEYTMMMATSDILHILARIPGDNYRWRVMKAASWIAFGDGDMDPELPKELKDAAVW